MNCVLQGENVDRKKRQRYIEIIDPKKKFRLCLKFLLLNVDKERHIERERERERDRKHIHEKDTMNRVLQEEYTNTKERWRDKENW